MNYPIVQSGSMGPPRHAAGGPFGVASYLKAFDTKPNTALPATINWLPATLIGLFTLFYDLFGDRPWAARPSLLSYSRPFGTP
jgi:hypothetical protein